MIKYRGTYRVFTQKDINNIYSTNDQDTYLQCSHHTQIYRYNDDTLAILFTSTGYKNNRIKDIESIGIQLTNFVLGDSESVYLFPESDIIKIADILKPRILGANKSPKSGQRKSIKKEMSEGKRKEFGERMAKAREKRLLNKNINN